MSAASRFTEVTRARRTVPVLLVAALALGASAPLAAGAAPVYNLLGTWKSGPLVGGVRSAANGTQTVTQMDMSTGLFSGYSEVSGTKFVLAGKESGTALEFTQSCCCLLYTSPSPRDRQKSRMPSSA